MMQATPPKTLASPCVSVCSLDPARRYCLGCLRTLDEIAVWGEAGDDRRRVILEACARRRQRQQLATPADEFNNLDEFYPCVGVCMTDPDSGYCVGCGRPPAGTPGTEVDPAGQPDADNQADAESSTKPVV
ncbi:MAG: DUF1289 domain-containing protein [Propionivibrio sp.]